MNSIRLAVVAGIVFLAGAAQAAVGTTAQGWSQEDARVAASQQVGAPAVDLTACSVGTSAAVNEEFKVLSVPDQDRGYLTAGSACAVPDRTPAPSKVDDRYRR
jgi:hypothetical protein